MSFGWNQCYPNCAPMTVTLQPPPFTMNIPGSSLYCPDQLLCIDPCRPCSPTACAPMICSPTMCGPAMCAPAACAPATCAPAPCAPMVCNSGLSRGRYSSCFSSCSLPPRKCLPRVHSICDPCPKY